MDNQLYVITVSMSRLGTALLFARAPARTPLSGVSIPVDLKVS